MISSAVYNGSMQETLSYNSANRLISATGSGVTEAISAITYDAFGKRITKANPGYPAILYTYDVDGNLIEENDAGTVTDYIYLNGVNIANWEPSQPHLYFIDPDRLGVPQVSRDEYGLTNWAAYSQPYGGMTQTVATGGFTGPVTQNLRLPGQYFDHEYGTHYNGTRDFSPNLGRYTEVDSIGLGGGLNLYGYANGNPLTYIDQNGLAPGDHYSTPDAAAIAAITDVNPTSISQNIEYAGRIYQFTYGSGKSFRLGDYSYTAPTAGTNDSSTPGSCPAHTDPKGDYHTHAAYDPNYNNENFSIPDKQSNDSEGTPGYLGTPQGYIKKYTPIPNLPLSGQTTTLGSGAK